MDFEITGFGIFIGIVCGVIVQVAANWFVLRWQTNNAKDVFRCELELNLSEIEKVKERSKRIRDRVTAGQVSEFDLLLPMQDFDYSAMGPLVQSGHFHKLLGTDGVKKYFSASKFFNNQMASYLSETLRNEQKIGKSVDFLDWLDTEIAKHERNFLDVKDILGRA